MPQLPGSRDIGRLCAVLCAFASAPAPRPSTSRWRLASTRTSLNVVASVWWAPPPSRKMWPWLPAGAAGAARAGRLDPTITPGRLSRVYSATHAPLSEHQKLKARTVQHNAAINPGSSGGADLRRRVHPERRQGTHQREFGRTRKGAEW